MRVVGLAWLGCACVLEEQKEESGKDVCVYLLLALRVTDVIDDDVLLFDLLLGLFYDKRM